MRIGSYAKTWTYIDDEYEDEVPFMRQGDTPPVCYSSDALVEDQCPKRFGEQVSERQKS